MLETVPLDRACVLVVDDEEDTREALRELVEMTGCSALLAANGAQALELLQTRRPCLVILDLMMPVMTGMELIEAMGREPALSELVIVISTSAPERAPAGFPVVQKPVDIQRVFELIARTCVCTRPAPNLRAPR